MKTIYIIAISCLSAAKIMAQHNPYIQAVDEYVPAPGQFINTLPEYEEGDDALTMAKKCTERLAGNSGGMVCLGAWGGYITFHFDHPVVNVDGEMDLYIAGNAMTGNAEAGIVMVSQDENGNGLADDTWYELRGSADESGQPSERADASNQRNEAADKDALIQQSSIGIQYGYEVTYTKMGDSLDVAWRDNMGNEGSIARNSFHQQEYFPLWIGSPLTFVGTRLPDNAHDKSGNGSYWVLDAFSYGYVDNLPNKDTLGCSLDIGWAVEPLTRERAKLKYIDFVRVYTALNQHCGWIGETSTEITGAMDLHPDATAGVIETIVDPKGDNQVLDLLGRRTNQDKGIIIKNHKPILKL